MALPVSVLAPGVAAAGVPASAKVTTNARVTTAAGPLGVIADVMQFPGPPAVGNWVVGSARVQVMGMPVINQSSTGTSFGPPPVSAPTGPMVVTQGDPRVSAM
jgi:hypothetical protein